MLINQSASNHTTCLSTQEKLAPSQLNFITITLVMVMKVSLISQRGGVEPALPAQKLETARNQIVVPESDSMPLIRVQYVTKLKSTGTCPENMPYLNKFTFFAFIQCNLLLTIFPAYFLSPSPSILSRSSVICMRISYIAKRYQTPYTVTGYHRREVEA